MGRNTVFALVADYGSFTLEKNIHGIVDRGEKIATECAQFWSKIEESKVNRLNGRGVTPFEKRRCCLPKTGPPMVPASV